MTVYLYLNVTVCQLNTVQTVKLLNGFDFHVVKTGFKMFECQDFNFDETSSNTIDAFYRQNTISTKILLICELYFALFGQMFLYHF